MLTVEKGAGEVDVGASCEVRAEVMLITGQKPIFAVAVMMLCSTAGLAWCYVVLQTGRRR